MTSKNSKQEANRLLNNLFSTMESLPPANGISTHQPRPSDIIIATYPKAGTTMLQNMCYQIVVATGGAPPFDPQGTNFDDIDRVAPWIDFAPIVGIAECPSDPRIFKTHSSAHSFNLSESKFIYCIRNPVHFPASWCDFIVDWFSDEKITDRELRCEILQEFTRRRLLQLHPDGRDIAWKYDTWYSHVRDWTRQPRHNILVLFYEEVVTDLSATVNRIASFMGRSLSEEGLRTVVARCDRKVMASSDQFKCLIWGRTMGLDPYGGMRAMMAHRPGFKEFSIETATLEKMAQMMKDAFGVETYQEACDVIRKEQRTLLES